MVPLLLAFLGLAHAQTTFVAPEPEVPIVPSAGLAAESGPGALWVNPANMAYDPELRWAAYGRWDEDAPHPWSGAATAGIGGFSGGLRWHADDTGSDFAVDLGVAVRLPKRIAVGGALRFHIPHDAPSIVGFDLAASWRPLPWIGASLVARTVGSRGGLDSPYPQVGGGLAVRPAGRALVLGIDYVHTFGDVFAADLVSATARIRPTRGLFFRASIDSTLRFGAGVELFFGGAGFGLHGGSGDARGFPGTTLYVASDERDETLVRRGRQVDVVTLETAPAYLPEQPLLRRAKPSWLDTLQAFDEVQRAPGLAGTVVLLGDAELDWAQWEELRSAFLRVRAADREVVAVLVGTPGNGALLAASAASQVLVHPAAEVRLTGPAVESWHAGGLLDALGVEVQVARRSDFKTAAEPWTTTEPSSSEREQQRALVTDLHGVLVRALAQGRTRSEAEVKAWVDGGPWSAEEAVRLGIADARAYPDQARALIEERLGGRAKLVDLSKRPPSHSPWEAPDRIAVVYIEGPITRGPSSRGGLIGGATTGSETIARQLEAAALDVSVRAVVVRVDSPGGSAVAADEIARGVARVQGAGKPVVVSMGGTATSGGYWVAADADAIWAEPSTVTGSIGVLAVKASVAPLLERLGVGTSLVAEGRNAGMDSNLRPWDPIQAQRMQSLVDATYAQFVDRVARGRNLSPEAVEAVAQGRVWSGLAARDRGLIDELGGLQDAVEDAARRAGIPARRAVVTISLRDRRGLAERLLPSLDGMRTTTTLRLAARGISAAPPITLPALLAPVLSGPAVIAAHPEEHLWLLDPSWVAGGVK